MASTNSRDTNSVRRSRRLAGLQPTARPLDVDPEWTAGDSEHSNESESDPSSSDEGSAACQPPLRYRTPGSMPVTGQSYCNCPRKSGDLECQCGEEDTEYFEWHWDEVSKSQASHVSADGKTVRFHVDYSCGTAAVRGNKAMATDQHFWEVKMTTPVYGTDMMVGIGTSDVPLDSYRHQFCSLLGRDAESWGLSYMGNIHHRGDSQQYAEQFGQGSIIGVHLDMWLGTLSFYKNRQPLGIAYRGLQGKNVYPMVCSTAARSGMKIIKACSFTTSLQFMCCQVLRSYIPIHLCVMDSVMLPPGLKSFLFNNLSWLLRPVKRGSSNKSRNKNPGLIKASSSSSVTESRASFYELQCVETSRKRKADDDTGTDDSEVLEFKNCESHASTSSTLGASNAGTFKSSSASDYTCSTSEVRSLGNTIVNAEHPREPPRKRAKICLETNDDVSARSECTQQASPMLGIRQDFSVSSSGSVVAMESGEGTSSFQHLIQGEDPNSRDSCDLSSNCSNHVELEKS